MRENGNNFFYIRFNVLHKVCVVLRSYIDGYLKGVLDVGNFCGINSEPSRTYCLVVAAVVTSHPAIGKVRCRGLNAHFSKRLKVTGSMGK